MQILCYLEMRKHQCVPDNQVHEPQCGDLIDCVVIPPSADGKDSGSDGKICLKIQGKEKNSNVSLMVGKVEPLQSLMDQYRAAMGLHSERKLSFLL
ncbi:hypothetical protein GDO86_017895 [Hymenochirus boettgeri]|uniref:Uncharacterized protein n=1 Tax=Hymenochirus boettgeri TaxID=247094 RepID=A0A8T2IJQ7_9PIPI|nr:hypothetical protein GDO86_017895 [Hymenochirus boettgeri]